MNDKIYFFYIFVIFLGKSIEIYKIKETLFILQV